MARMVGLSRNLKLAWLNQAVELASSKLTENEIKEKLNEYPDYSLEIHWCMMLAAYPVFVDMCKLIGKMSEFQDEITLAQLKQKLFDE